MKSKLLSLLHNRNVKRKQSNCIILFGKKGAGKSYLAMRIGKLLDANFTLDRIVFSPQEFFDLLDKGLPPGSVIVYDEIGVGANARDAQTNQNKNMSFIAQTIRPMGITLLFTTISWGLVDSQVRNLMDFSIKVEGHTGNITNFKFFVIEPRMDKANPDMKHLIFNDDNGRPVKYVLWTATKVDGDIAMAYEEKRMKYLQTINKDAAMGSREGERYRFGKAVGRRGRIDLDAIATEVLNDKQQFMDGKRVSPLLIRTKYKLGIVASNNVARLIKIKSKMKKDIY